MNMIPLKKDILEKHGIFHTPSTLRKWHHLGQNAALFLKIGNRLYIDLREWNKLIEEAYRKRTERIQRLERLNQNVEKSIGRI